MVFEVASVRLDNGDFKGPSFPLSADDSFSETAGLFHADFPLAVYIQFAYKLWLTPDQTRAMLDKLPGWASKDRFLVEARAEGHPTKDQFRLMMQSLLINRFGLKLHFEAREVPVLEMVLIKSGKLGPNLKPHSEGPPCEAPGREPKNFIGSAADAFPAMCAVIAMRPLPNRNMQVGSRNNPMQFIASVIPTIADVGRPVVDGTGLTGRYDFTVEFSMEATRAQSSAAEPPVEIQGTPFLQAASDQLGVKLVPGHAVLTVPVVDAVDKPSEN
jgi:uncharacterized protein (TIGR03435 family)